MKTALTWIFAAWLFAVPLYAQQAGDDAAATADQPPADTEQAAASAETATTDAADSADDADTQATDDTGLTVPPADEDFVPSVRITEDLPVAFPADI